MPLKLRQSVLKIVYRHRFPIALVEIDPRPNTRARVLCDMNVHNHDRGSKYQLHCLTPQERQYRLSASKHKHLM